MQTREDLARRCLLFRCLLFVRSHPGWFTWAVLLLGVTMTFPLFRVSRPPIQDLPQHVAAVRLLADYHVPELRFSQYFVRELGHTQYLSVYLLAWLLTPCFGALLATKLVLALSVALTPLAMLSLLRALGRDERLCLLTLPLLYNIDVILGFLNFVAALPLLFWGLALGVRCYRRPTLRGFMGLGMVTLFTFYSHVVMAVLLAISIAAFGLARGVRRGSGYLWAFGLARGVRRGSGYLWALLPTVVAAALWRLTSPSGNVVGRLLRGLLLQEREAAPVGWNTAWQQLPQWFTGILRSEGDEVRMALWCALIFISFLSMSAVRSPSSREPQENETRWNLPVMVIGSLALLCFFAYFVLPGGFEFIWPLSGRFPLLFAFLLIPLLDIPCAGIAWGVAAVATGLGLAACFEISSAFANYEMTELAGLDTVIAEIPVGSRVGGLAFERGSRWIEASPRLQFVAWIQAARGGAVMFSFAQFPQSPFRFRDEASFPKVPAHWEWHPEAVDPDVEFATYDYVVALGGPGRVARSQRFSLVKHSGPFYLFERKTGESSSLPMAPSLHSPTMKP